MKLEHRTLPTSGTLPPADELSAFLRRAAEHLAPGAAIIAGRVVEALASGAFAAPPADLPMPPRRGRPPGQSHKIAARDEALRRIAGAYCSHLKSPHARGLELAAVADRARRAKREPMPGTPVHGMWCLLQEGHKIPKARELAKIITCASQHD
ncbi:hypothetical protein METY_3459 [Methylopila sp. Yamaguchi]|nr:hypothetical protein METY_3459 [Methylopila sp. Yamaguchi]